MINIQFPDGSKKQYNKGISCLEIAQGISEGLARNAIACQVDEKLVDMAYKIQKDATLKIITLKDEQGINILRHSAAHLMAQAVQRLYPEAVTTIGPVIENGFYYDFDNLEIKEEDLEKIQAEMKKIIKEKIPIKRIEHKDKSEALKTYAGNPYKVELIKEFEDDASSYEQGEWKDLCRGPHVPNTKFFEKAGLKLNKLAGAYWRGNAENKMLTRIYGLCFATKQELAEYLELRKEAEKRDHRKIGQQLKLFSMHDEAAGMPFFHDKGYTIFAALVDFMTSEMRKLDYQVVRTPLILTKDLWLQSGHWGHYKENMYFSKIDEQEVAIKPMNCPGHILVYKSRSHSYRELPLKMGEFGIVHRHELSGVLSGLFRVRFFTQDDAHVFCTKEQVKDEIRELIQLVNKIYSAFGFKYSVELSTKPEKAMGSQEIWDLAEKSLAQAIEEEGMKYQINPGDGAFYGPKLDFHVKDAIGRSWQCGTIQLDFSMPEKFDLTYEGNDGKQHRPVMLHRAIYGSLERFIGILIEHFAGKFPLWMNPLQAKILPIADRHVEYAKKVANQMRAAGMRVEIDVRQESTKKKIRDAQVVDMVPLMITVGDKEQENNTLAIRTLDNKVKFGVKIEELISNVQKNVQQKELKYEL